MNRRILVVDDEEAQANIIANILEKERYEVRKAYSAEEAVKIAVREEFSVLLVDLKMPGIGGIGLLNVVKEKGLDANFIIMTAFGTIETAVEAMKGGAYTYLTKPFGKDELLINVGRAVDAYDMARQNERLREELKAFYDEKKLVGSSAAMREVYELIDKVAASDAVNVLITGESGTGKELVAREIHARSPRTDMLFVPVNCSAIPETLLESEFFGYERGAFTGAVTKREGKFKKADGGTIFLDEIGDMPLSMQVKLLRVIQEKEITPVGGDEAVYVDVRIIAATNRDVERMVTNGEFREDLFYRLNVIPIHVPPLRERKGDIPELVRFISEKLNKKLRKNVQTVQEAVVGRLMDYDFPGNVRELENMMERAFILSGSNELKIEHFPMLASVRTAARSSAKKNTLKEASRRARDRVEAQLIEKTLKETNWNRARAAKLLKIDYKTLRTKMADFNIHPDRIDGGRKTR